MLGGPGADFLSGVAFWSIKSSGLQNAMVRGRQLCTQLSIFEGSLAELLRTTAACTFSTSQLPKVVRT